jgi:integration host factor subunit alpha
MSLGKSHIVKNITTKAHISRLDSNLLLNSFLDIIKKKSSSNIVKITNFGSFNIYITPTRIGRNPKTKEEFVILKKLKLAFKTSKKIKNIFN